VQSWVVEAGSDIENVADGLLSAISTLTTVGRGDRFPTSPLGRRIAVALMLVRVGVSTCSPRRLRRSTLSEGGSAGPESNSDLLRFQDLSRQDGGLRERVKIP
jgi:voltage-gated potassium channel